MSQYNNVTVSEMASEIIVSSRPGSLPYEELVSIILEAMSPCSRRGYGTVTWMPLGMADESYFGTCIAIGPFGTGSFWGGRSTEKEEQQSREVSIRRVVEPGGGDECRSFESCLSDDDEWQRVYTDCDPGYHHENPAFFVHECCFRYVEDWVQRDILLPRSTSFPDDPAPLSFASELYEIVNTRVLPRSKSDAKNHGSLT